MKTITNKLRGTLVVLAAAAACSVASRPAHAQVIFSDNFNYGVTGLNFNAFPNWTVSGGTVDLIGAGSGHDFYPGNGQYVDLDGSSNNAGVLTSSSLVLTAGTYELSFLLGKNGTATESMVVSVGSLFSENFVDAGAIGSFETVVRTFSVGDTFNASIIFDHAGNDSQGFIIDNVTLTQLTAVPEPSSIALMAGPAALLLGGLVARRRRAA